MHRSQNEPGLVSLGLKGEHRKQSPEVKRAPGLGVSKPMLKKPKTYLKVAQVLYLQIKFYKVPTP